MKVHRKTRVKSLALLLSVVLLLTVTVGGTLAYLFVKTDPLTNQLEMGRVTSEVQENYSVKNTGNVDAYIRIAVVANWVDANDNVHWKQPAVSVKTNGLNNKWTAGRANDGYYYFSEKVASMGLTEIPELNLPDTSSKPEGYKLQIQILAEAIQVGGGAAAAAWGAENVPSGWQ